MAITVYDVQTLGKDIRCYFEGTTFYVRGDDLDTRERKTLTVVDSCGDVVVSEDTLIYDLDTVKEEEGYSTQFLYTARSLSSYYELLDCATELQAFDEAIKAVKNNETLDSDSKKLAIDALEMQKTSVIYDPS